MRIPKPYSCCRARIANLACEVRHSGSFRVTITSLAGGRFRRIIPAATISQSHKIGAPAARAVCPATKALQRRTACLNLDHATGMDQPDGQGVNLRKPIKPRFATHGRKARRRWRLGLFRRGAWAAFVRAELPDRLRRKYLKQEDLSVGAPGFTRTLWSMRMLSLRVRRVVMMVVIVP